MPPVVKTLLAWQVVVYTEVMSVTVTPLGMDDVDAGETSVLLKLEEP